MASTAYALLETGGGTAYPLRYWRSSQVVPRIPQGVSAVPTFKVIGLSIWTQNPTKTQNKHYEMKE